ncbi:unnamed protein product [Didymodactylos carnosus]|uniref:Uncharacterized protein n=1 Tax=Didymodactylos carnosus TaxID=1234261 RepID=A0A815VNW3_9BILA|nr:unnamed protein product [Didymodactylos carnosus]CAF4392267.1 unnamed protein product [Didymodactylos carnosus]
MGEQKAQLLMDHVTRECFEKTSLYKTILYDCTHISGLITRELGTLTRYASTKLDGKLASILMEILKRLPDLLKAGGAVDEMKKSAAKFLQNANQIIQDAITEHKSLNATVAASRNAQLLRDQKMQQWKETNIEISNQLIATHVLQPILSYGVNHLVGYIGNSIKKQYRSYKEDRYRADFESLKKDFDEKVKNAKFNVEEHTREVKTYHEALVKLLGKTRDAKLFASILRENVPMDMTCVQACTNVLDACMRGFETANLKEKFTGICIVVEGSDGSSHEYSSSKNPSHKIFLTLDDNHFRASGFENTEALQNSCLYEALMRQVPSLKRMFSNGKEFRECLSDHIKNNKGLQYTIAQGWHRYTIEKRNYGGAIKEENFSPDVLYNKHVSNVKEALKNIYKNSPTLSREIQNKIQECVDNIDKIATGDLKNGNAAHDINTIVKDFDKWLDNKFQNDELKLRNELKQTMSTFGERVNQTVRQNCKIMLDEFREQAIRADRSSTDPDAVHVADRIDFTRDDINLQSLANNSTKLRNDPDIIASVIHAKLNKDLPKSEWRYNTVIVGIHNEAVYIAFNQVGIANGQETYVITEKQGEEIFQYLNSKKLLVGRYKVIFLEEKSTPTDRTTCRAPHGEMQILRFWNNSGILREDNKGTRRKPWSIGGSKPPCFCCSVAMKTRNVNHKVYGKANMSPRNWIPPDNINVKVKMAWNVQTKSRRK